MKPQKPFKTVRLAIDASRTAGLRGAVGTAPGLQVLLNVIINAGAAIASRPGGAQDDDVVTVRVRRAGARVRIEVDDTGPGIPESIRTRMFEPFVTTKDVGEGTGLGLAVCRGVVEAAGGTIGIDEEHRGGARFVVELPAAAD